MSIKIQAKTDTSFLFSGLSASNGSGFDSMSWLKDYGLVKSGAYSKLMKAYYSDNEEEDTSKAAKSLMSDKAKVMSANKTVSDTYNKIAESAFGSKIIVPADYRDCVVRKARLPVRI